MSADTEIRIKYSPARTGPGTLRVYRGQALVTRQVDFQAQVGAQELVVTGLPERIVPDSLYATADQGVVIRAVRYRAAAVSEPTSSTHAMPLSRLRSEPLPAGAPPTGWRNLGSSSNFLFSFRLWT